jgi:hypothetical protein
MAPQAFGYDSFAADSDILKMEIDMQVVYM